jgi:hypothetical protein
MAIVVTKGSWQVQNLRGVMKRFMDVESDEARAWMSNRDEEVEKKEGAAKRPKLTELERADRKAARDEVKRLKKEA